jgi:hypothetical protein
MDVPISTGPLPSMGGALDVGDYGFEVLNQEPKPFRLRSQREQFLFEIKFERQRSRERKRKLRHIGGRKILFRARNAEQLRVQLNRARFVLLCCCVAVVVNQNDLSAQKRTLFIHSQQFKSPAAFSNEIEAAIFILFYHRDDFSRASHFSEALFNGAYHAKRLVLRQAFANHLFVARLENVQRQGSAGKQNDIERE